MGTHEHTPTTPPDTFRADTTIALDTLAKARGALDATTPQYEELTKAYKEELEKYTDILSKAFTDGTLARETIHMPIPDIPAVFIEEAIEQLMHEAVFNYNLDIRGYFLSQILKDISDREGVHDFRIKATRYPRYIGSYLSDPTTLTIEGDCGMDTGSYLNGGLLIIKGDCDHSVGINMKRGNLIVEGNSGGLTGFLMQGGTLSVEGNSGSQTGKGMHGGTLMVKGNCGEDTGMEMNSGVLIIDGEVASWKREPLSTPFRPSNHGRIIHKGLVLWDNGTTQYTPSK